MTNTNTSGVGSLPYAVANVAEGEDVVFDSNVAGQTISLNTLSVARAMNFVNDNTEAVTIDLNTGNIVVSTTGTISMSDNLTLTVTGNNAAYAIHSSGTLNMGTVAATCNVTGDNVAGIYSSSAMTIGSYSGDLTATANSISVGILTDGDLVIANGISGSITVTSTSTMGEAYGIYSTGSISAGSGNPLLVTGSVSASGSDACAIHATQGINLKVDSEATVSAVSQSSNWFAIYNDGNYDSQIELVAGCEITGMMNCAGSADTLTLSGDAADSTSYSGALNSFETINITGGQWTLNTYIPGSSTINFNGGTLNLQGSGTSGVSLEVADGAILGGNATLLNLINSGTVSPGNSIGTITVTGNYTNAAGSTMEIEINDAGQSDLVDVTGTATITGGTVSVKAESGSYNDGDTYDFLTATGGVSGTFDSVTDDLAFLDAELVYFSNYVQILLSAGSSNYDDEAATFNQHAVAGYLDAHSSGASGDFQTVLDELDTLSGPEARLAFDAMSGEIFGSLSTIGIENQERFMRLISQRVRARHILKGLGYASNDDSYRSGDVQYVCNRCSTKYRGWQPWFEGYGIAGRIAGDGNAQGMSYSTGGLAVGLERQLTRNMLLGVVGGYSSSYANQVGSSDRGAIDGGQAAVYLHRDTDRFYTTGIAAYGYNTYDTHRRINFGAIDRTTDANYCGNNASFLLEIGRNVFFNRFNMQPYAGLEYIQLHQNDFIESGADSIDIAVDGIRADAFRGLLGSRFVLDYELDNGRLLTLEGRAAWRHEFLNDNRIVDATFAGQAGTAFAVAGVNVDRDAGILGLGLTSRLCSGWSIFANYDALVSENYTAHAGSGGIQYVW